MRKLIGAIILISLFFIALGLAGNADFTACSVGGQC